LLQAISGGNGIYTIEDVFRQMSEAVPEFSGLTMSRIGDLGVQIMPEDKSPEPPASRPRKRRVRREKKKRSAMIRRESNESSGNQNDEFRVNGQ
jgi:hypothetical protein